MTKKTELSTGTPTIEVTKKYLDALRKAVGLHIDPDTAEVEWTYSYTVDPYGYFPIIAGSKSEENTSSVLPEVMC
jgi:hypothetical protein